MTTNLYIPARLRAHKLSAAVGSGKTRAAIAWIASPSNATRNVLYVAPTVALLRQTERNLREALAVADGGRVRNVHAIHSEVEDPTAPVRVEALTALDDAEDGDGQVLMLTTTTFLQCVAKVRRPELWTVILDEAFKPVEFDPLNLGTDALAGWGHVCELFAVDPDQGHRLVPREGRKGLVEDVAAGRFSVAGDQFKAYQKAASFVVNPAMRCELVLTDGAKALLAGDEPKKRKKRSDGKEQGTLLQFAYYVDPSAFSGFRQVLFLSALFEQTILYMLWTRALGVTFTEHPDFPVELLRDTHKEQGRFLAVGHLLHKDDNASLENLQRNIYTGAASETRPGQRVIDHVVQAAAFAFGEDPFLLQTNERYGYTRGAPCLPRNAVWIPTFPHGRNDFQGVNCVAALAVCNPTPQEVEWVRSRTGASAREVTQAYRIHSIYQAIGRCSIRKAEVSTDAKVVLTVGADDAQFIADLFPGSHWMGQVGTLPSLSGLQQQQKAETKEPGKVEVMAAIILRHLDAVPPGANEVKSRRLKAVIEAAESAREHLRRNGADEQFCGIDRNLWQRALSLACLLGRGWQKRGHSLHRVTAELYGFQPQEQQAA